MKVVGLFQRRKKGSSLLWTLMLISILSMIFLFWNECYKVQMASYYKACRLEENETQLDLAYHFMKAHDKKTQYFPIEVNDTAYVLRYTYYKELDRYCVSLYDVHKRYINCRFRSDPPELP